MTAKMPKIVVPEQAVWKEEGPEVQAVEVADDNSYWILGGGILFFAVAVVIIFVSSVLCW